MASFRYRFIPHRLTVPFEELDGSPVVRSTSSWAGDGATRKLKCLTTNRIELERELLGYVYGNVVHLPASFGVDRPNLIATNVTLTPFGRTGAVGNDNRYADYEHVILNVAFEVVTKIPSPQYGFVTLSEEVRDLSEFVTLPVKNLYWGTGGDKEEIDTFDAPGKMNYGLELVYTISNAYRVPPEIFDYVGKVNSEAINHPGIGYVFEPYTLLYASPSVSSELTFGGTIYRITLRFLHKENGTPANPKGWNWFPRISAAGEEITYETITDGTDSKIFYGSADYRGVFI